VADSYPRQTLGWAFERVMQTWGIPAERLARQLTLSPAALVGLALCPIPSVESPTFGAHVHRLAGKFGIAPWRLEVVCRIAALDSARVRE
jgi:hypothetical protein